MTISKTDIATASQLTEILGGTVDSKSRQFYESQGLAGKVGLGRKVCVLVVDMTKAYTSPSYRVGCDQSEVLGEIAGLLKTARVHRTPVFFTTMAYRPDGLDAGLIGLKMPMVLDLKTDDPNAVEIDERIKPLADEVVFNKTNASAFFGTPLVTMLAAAGIDTIILTGCSTSGCIRATAIDGLSYGFHVVIPEECVGDRLESAHKANLFDIASKYADVMPLSAVIEYLDGIGTADGSSDAGHLIGDGGHPGSAGGG